MPLEEMGRKMTVSMLYDSTYPSRTTSLILSTREDKEIGVKRKVFVKILTKAFWMSLDLFLSSQASYLFQSKF